MSKHRKNSENEMEDDSGDKNDPEAIEPELKYPKSVFFIVSNEFCERFSYYGMRTVLTLYIQNKLAYDDDTTTAIYHAFTMFVYFFPLFGAMLADSALGKFRTIFYLSVIYAIGQFLLSLASAPTIGLSIREFSLLGLFLIAVGSGGIKPCVAAFGGDQFILPQQERYLSLFFSFFYFAINSGSLISSFLTPVLRSNISCFDEKTCYSLAFFVPAVLMAISIVIFLMGRPLYRMTKPTDNVVWNVTKCVSCAIYNKVKSKVKRDHWLEHAEVKYDRKLINDIKAALQVLKLFLPLPVFWALFDQQGSRWTFQATQMDGEIGSFLLQPDQMQVVNPLLILLFIPIFETCIYPLFAKINFLNTPLKKLTVGGLLAALSFVVSALVEFQLEKTYPVLPSAGSAQIRIFNTLNCPIDLNINEHNIKLNSLDFWADVNIKSDANFVLNCTVMNCPELKNCTGSIRTKDATALSYVITPEGLQKGFEDTVARSKSGLPTIRARIYNKENTPAILQFRKDSKTELQFQIEPSINETLLQEITPNQYDIYLNNILVESNVALKLGGVYTVIGETNAIDSTIRTISVTQPNSMHMLWLIPQYVIITMGEVMFSVTGLEFAFTQAPNSMKSLLQASWLLTVAFGNLIVVIVAETSAFNSQAYEFILFAVLMFIDIMIFALMAKFYKYVEVPDDSEEIDLDKSGTVNASYSNDEKS